MISVSRPFRNNIEVVVMQIELTDAAVSWFKMNLSYLKIIKYLCFRRYGGEFQLKQGFSPAFTVEPKENVDVGYEQHYDGLNIVVAEKRFVVLRR